jgi:hypothetical protein
MLSSFGVYPSVIRRKQENIERKKIKHKEINVGTEEILTYMLFLQNTRFHLAVVDAVCYIAE